jgi:hypothetical protein
VPVRGVERWDGRWFLGTSLDELGVVAVRRNERLVLRLGSQSDQGFGRVFDVCRSAAGALMAGVCTTGYRRSVRGAEIGARTVRFVFGIINGAGSAGNASIRVARVARIHR